MLARTICKNPRGQAKEIPQVPKEQIVPYPILHAAPRVMINMTSSVVSTRTDLILITPLPVVAR